MKRRGKELLERGGLKVLACDCGREVMVDSETVSVKCSTCVMKKIPLEEASPKPKVSKEAEKGFPKGWRFMKQFVHSDGRVFEKGVESTSLKNTLPPTVIKSKFERRKLREERELRKLNRLAKQYKKKQKARKMNNARGTGSTTSS